MKEEDKGDEPVLTNTANLSSNSPIDEKDMEEMVFEDKEFKEPTFGNLDVLKEKKGKSHEELKESDRKVMEELKDEDDEVIDTM